MLIESKRKLGVIKRGVLGFFQNNFIKPPQIPKTLKPISIGTSVKGNEIQCFKIGNGKIKILYAFGIHGNEVGTVKLAHYFLDWLHKNFNNDQYTIFVIPCINPDEYNSACQQPEYFKGGKTGRFNGNNVDLNRNFDTPSFKQKSKWSFGKNYSEKTDIYCGRHGGSEPEIKALTSFIKNEKIQVLFMYHNAGKDVMPNSSKLAQKLAKIYSDKTDFQLIKKGHWKDLQQTGTAAEWCDINNVAYIEIEGSTRWGSDWNKQKKAIIAMIFANST